MNMDRIFTKYLSILFPTTYANKPAWKVDSENPDDMEPMLESSEVNVVFTGDVTHKMTLATPKGIYISHFQGPVAVPSIVGNKTMTIDYFEIWAMAYTPATHWEPEDADPYFISAHTNWEEAFLEFMKEDFRVTLEDALTAEAESEASKMDF